MMLEKELWIKMAKDTSSEKIIHLWKNGHDFLHPWTISFENIFRGRKIAVYKIANSFEEGLPLVKDYLINAKKLGFHVAETRGETA
jgi:hypothetical protein